MFTPRRWWDRHGLQTVLVGLALGTAWFIRQTQGAFVVEMYRWAVHPFQTTPTSEERLTNARIVELQERLTEMENQNQRLQDLVGYVSTPARKGVVAAVIGRSADHWWQQVTIDRGSNDGIQPGSVVTGVGGLIGRVISVTPNTSRILLLSDPASQVGVTISRSRYTGYMRGQSANRVVMEFFDKVPDVRPGDVVSTSSFSQLFPPGLPIGRIESINLSKSPAPEAVIELSAPISHLEWVNVTPNQKAKHKDAAPSLSPSSDPLGVQPTAPAGVQP